ncbi:hypothetical protein BDY24DRAFT_35058 [Mrakia frigida]|uniref:uncharacterized protein n=1 Tax=Mrakia frigida TaxID=29902 RepID=UPI003FCBFBCD
MDPSPSASQQPPSTSSTPPSNALPSHPSAPPTDSSLDAVPPPPPPPSALLLCSKCSNGPFADKVRLTEHTSRLHSISVTTSTPQGEFRANREDDDLVHCPVCSKGYANTSTWRVHVKKCAKAKEDRERGQGMKETILSSSFDGVYAAGTSRDASGTSSFHDKIYQ